MPLRWVCWFYRIYLWFMSFEQPIIWITGQPGAGKSTVGRALMTGLKTAGHDVFMVDGDDLRALTANASSLAECDVGGNLTTLAHIRTMPK